MRPWISSSCSKVPTRASRGPGKGLTGIQAAELGFLRPLGLDATSRAMHLGQGRFQALGHGDMLFQS